MGLDDPYSSLCDRTRFIVEMFSKVNTEMILHGIRTYNIVESDAAAILFSFLAAFIHGFHTEFIAF